MASVETKPEEPDIMNDPAYDTSKRGKLQGVQEQDTCRICRGEGSQEEPLFYPCKCSGSIKFVHQACLMEWLSHSQKKHCELCKTSFRFTKLYDPQMPQTVPLSIFLRQATLHTLKNLLIWARWNLVVFVWLGWFPWLIRLVWRCLFWLGDGGWVTRQELERHSFQLQGLSTSGNNSITEHPQNKTLNASRALANFSFTVQTWAPLHRAFNLTFGESTLSRIAWRVYHGILLPSVSVKISSVGFNSSETSKPPSRAPSIFSEIEFLRGLTRWDVLNNFFIDVLEGQLITILIVAAFILIFLIREWVVQQQPALNMGPVPAAENGVEQRVVEHDRQQAPADEEREVLDIDNELANVVEPPNDQQQDDAATDWEPGQQVQDADEPERALTDPGRLREQLLTSDDLGSERLNKRRYSSSGESTGHGTNSSNHKDKEGSFAPNGASEGDASSSSRPSRSRPSRPRPPTRDAIAKVNEIQRSLEEQSVATGQDWPGIEVFMDFWKRSDSDPDEVLRLIEEEGRSDELRWIVAAMNRLKNSSRSNEGLISDIGSEGPPIQAEKPNVENSSELLLESPVLETEGEPSTDTSKYMIRKVDDSEESLTLLTDISKQASTPLPEKSSPAVTEDSSTGANTYQGPDSSNSSAKILTPEAEPTPSPTVGSSLGHDENETSPLPSQHEMTDHSQMPEQLQPDNHPDEPDLTEAQQRTTGRSSSSTEAILNWLWGELPETEDVPEEPQDEEQIVQDVAQEEPFVPVAQGRPLIEGNNPGDDQEGDPEVIRAAAEAGVDPNDPEPIEDGEDLEGVMELIGMQGPLAGLVQNGIFSAVLISLSVFLGIWIPYIAGKVLLVSLTNPIAIFVKLPLRGISTLTDVAVDSLVFLTTILVYWIDSTTRTLFRPFSLFFPFIARIQENRVIPIFAYKHALEAANRLTKTVVATADQFSESDIPIFSIIAHESLKKIEHHIATTASTVYSFVHDFADFPSNRTTVANLNWQNYSSSTFAVKDVPSSIWKVLREVASPSILSSLNLSINLDSPSKNRTLDFSLAEWSIVDRAIAICLGYLFFYAIGATFLSLRSSFRDASGDERDDGVFAEILNQAGGVMKVILIIGIEMIVFPLYCGTLLDMALLPLFENASLFSRLRFTITSPTTSLFIHWFIGTCYMFHFALFVSMCRKIMRSGVLYFIRDPDDPAFHPVRDVLERNVYTQLRKIAFSALVYGALVILCLGSVVWGVGGLLPGVFPIHWSSSEPVLEFPVDLLFYNFLMPVAVKIFKPSAGLNVMYEWWFRRCARLLRLTHFLFDEQRPDEEGSFKEQPSDQSELSMEQEIQSSEISRAPPKAFVRDGRLVRAPASDQVRIPKGEKTFVEVDEDGCRIDGQQDTEHGLHGRKNTMFATVYVPPHFPFRIGAFVVLLWLFAATTGICLTIVPLLFGRYVFAQLFLTGPRMNDMYAFATGVYSLGGPLYLMVRYRLEIAARLHSLRSATMLQRSTMISFMSSSLMVALRLVRLAYFYGVLALVLPSLVALMFEAYIFIPLHTYLWRSQQSTPPHTIHFISDWTLGILYVRVCARMILHHRHSRPARALRALVSARNNGASWLDPDIRLATRALILPALAVSFVALLVPIAWGYVANMTWFPNAPDESKALVYRYSYPTFLALHLALLCARMLWGAIRLWRARVRDEVYLIGERLHNFGDRKPAIRRAMTTDEG